MPSAAHGSWQQNRNRECVRESWARMDVAGAALLNAKGVYVIPRTPSPAARPALAVRAAAVDGHRAFLCGAVLCVELESGPSGYVGAGAGLVVGRLVCLGPVCASGACAGAALSPRRGAVGESAGPACLRECDSRIRLPFRALNA